MKGMIRSARDAKVKDDITPFTLNMTILRAGKTKVTKNTSSTNNFKALVFISNICGKNIPSNKTR